jgi:hypothetical protein
MPSQHEAGAWGGKGMVQRGEAWSARKVPRDVDHDHTLTAAEEERRLQHGRSLVMLHPGCTVGRPAIFQMNGTIRSPTGYQL